MLLNYFLAVLVLAFGFAGTVLALGGLLPGYLDPLSILIVVIFPLVYQCLLFGIPTVKIAFTAGFKKDAGREQVTKAQLFFKSYSKVLWFTVLVTVLMEMVALVIWLEDRSGFGPAIVLVLLSLLYTGLIHLLIIIPHSIFLKKRLIELNIEI